MRLRVVVLGFKKFRGYFENNLTFNELKEIAKKISFEDDRIERLYIEQLENQSMSSTVTFLIFCFWLRILVLMMTFLM